MRIDSQLSFVPLGSPLSLVAGAGVSIASPNTIDLLGVGVGVPPPSIIGLTPIVGTTHVFGTDFGIGEDRMLLDVVIGTGLTGSCTLNVALQLAPDTGLSGGYQPGAWQTVVETGALTQTQCSVNNTRIARFDWPPAFPENLRPRYARLLFQVPSGEYFTAGTIAFALVTPARDDYAAAYAAKNFSVS